MFSGRPLREDAVNSIRKRATIRACFHAERWPDVVYAIGLPRGPSPDY